MQYNAMRMAQEAFRDRMREDVVNVETSGVRAQPSEEILHPISIFHRLTRYSCEMMTDGNLSVLKKTY
jgi:hypothetical protein